MNGEDYQIRDLTPREFDCGTGPCPAVYETNKDSYLIIGKLVNPADAGLEKKVGEDEQLIEIPRGLLGGIVGVRENGL